MKTLKAICAATVMALALSVPAYSDTPTPGDGHSPGRSTECPTTVPESSQLSGITLVDILWVLASIY
jgi:hypothetical protein